MTRAHLIVATAGVMIMAIAGTPARAVVVGQSDTFQAGDVNEWYGGTVTANVGNGLAGPSDLYLTVRTNGNSSGSGSHLAIHNSEARWNGDYAAAGVTGVSVDIRNLGTTALNMRLVLFGSGTRYTSTSAIPVAVGSGWQHLTFPISQASMTRVLGTSAYTDVIANVNQIMFRHDDGTPSSGGSVINGNMGLDNITAVPAPGAAGCAVVIGAAVLARRRRASVTR